MSSPPRPDAEAPLFSRQFIRPFGALLAVQFTLGISLSVFLLLPKILVARMGASPSYVGLVAAVFGLAGVAVIPLVGARIDHARRVPMLVAAGVLMIVTPLGFLLVHDAGVLAVVLRGLQGACWALVYSAGAALAADLSPPRRLAQMMGLWGSANLITSALSPAFVEPLIDHAGPGAAYLVAAAAGLVSVGLTRLIDEPAPERSAAARAIPLHIVLRRPSTLRMIVIVTITGVAFGAMFTFHQPMALGLGIRNVRGFFIAYTAGALGVRLILGPVMDRVGAYRMTALSLGTYAAVVTAMSLLAPGRLEIFGGLFGVAHGVFFPSFMALIVGSTAPEERGRLLTVWNGSFLAGSIMALPLGALAAAVGYPAVFVAAGLATFGGMAILLRWPPAPYTTPHPVLGIPG
ncbi:MAG TPA: MFS transporter [Polyangia bacterium]|nr:MFS transporter [Polyangia bacterium]